MKSDSFFTKVLKMTPFAVYKGKNKGKRIHSLRKEFLFMAKGSVRKKGKKWYYRFYVEDESGKMVQREFVGRGRTDSG